MSIVVLLLALAVVLVAWLTAAGTAVRSVSRIWLRHWAERQFAGSAAAGASLARPQRLLLAAGAAGAMVVTLAGALLGAARPEGGWTLATSAIGLAAALLLFGRLIPRAIARRWAPRLVPVLVPPLQPVALAVTPVLRATHWLSRLVRHRRFPARADSVRGNIADLLREGELEGIGEHEEIQIITGVMQFGDKVVRDVMTPRTDIIAIDAEDAERDPAAVAREIAQSGYSRTPVYRGTLDEITGMIHAFDVFEAGGERLPPLRPVAYTPASKRCSAMLVEMLRGQHHLAVVLDEYGGTAGIVTLEDMLEELVGDIRDEHDEPAAPDGAAPVRAAVLEASTPVDEVARHFAVELPAEMQRHAQSLGGVVVRALGRIPTMGERFTLGPLDVTVVEAEQARVRRVLVQRAERAAPVALLPGPR